MSKTKGSRGMQGASDEGRPVDRSSTNLRPAEYVALGEGMPDVDFPDSDFSGTPGRRCAERIDAAGGAKDVQVRFGGQGDGSGTRDRLPGPRVLPEDRGEAGSPAPKAGEVKAGRRG
jgi:hypothetical protein